MFDAPCYQVLLLPRQEIAARGCTLAEARAWMEAYNAVMSGTASRAVIAEEPKQSDRALFSQVA